MTKRNKYKNKAYRFLCRESRDTVKAYMQEIDKAHNTYIQETQEIERDATMKQDAALSKVEQKTHSRFKINTRQAVRGKTRIYVFKGGRVTEIDKRSDGYRRYLGIKKREDNEVELRERMAWRRYRGEVQGVYKKYLEDTRHREPEV